MMATIHVEKHVCYSCEKLLTGKNNAKLILIARFVCSIKNHPKISVINNQEKELLKSGILV